MPVSDGTRLPDVQFGTANVRWACGEWPPLPSARRSSARARCQQIRQHPLGVGRVEVLGGLVEQHDPGRRNHRPGQQQPPALTRRDRLRAAGQHGRQAVGQTRPAIRRARPRPVPPPVRRLAQSPRATSRLSRTVVAKMCASSAKKLTALGNSDSSNCFRSAPSSITRPCSGGIKSGECHQQRRLTGTAGAGDGQPRAGCEVERHLVRQAPACDRSTRRPTTGPVPVGSVAVAGDSAVRAWRSQVEQTTCGDA